MGVIVTCSNHQGTKISVADSWLAGFTSLADFYVLDYYVIPSNSGNFSTKYLDGTMTEEIAAEQGISSVMLTPSEFPVDFGQENYPIPNEWLIQETRSGSPVMLPIATEEAVWMITSEAQATYKGQAGETYKHIFEAQRLFYIANGKGIPGKISLTRLSGSYSPEFFDENTPYVTCQSISNNEFSLHGEESYQVIDGQKTVAVNYAISNAAITTTYTYLEELIVPGSIPEVLRQMCLDYNAFESVDTYIFRLNDVTTTYHAVRIWSAPYDINQEILAWMTDEDYAAEHREYWWFFYVFKIGDTVSYVNTGQFKDLFSSVFEMYPIMYIYADIGGVPTVVQEYEVFADEIYNETLLGFPNRNSTCPYDSMTFHSHEGDIYTWTRRRSTWKISAAGMSLVTLAIPAEVTGTDGVRPTISYIGTFDETPLYLCICDGVDDGVKAVYTGSPFGSWTALPWVESGVDVMHVRPVKISPIPAENVLIGVVKTLNTDDEPIYKFAIMRNEAWTLLGQLPFAVDDANSFSACIFGNDQLVVDLINFPAPPHVTATSLIAPYELYEGIDIY